MSEKLALEIIFRQIASPVPDCWLPDVHWYVEGWDANCDTCRPAGILFCSVYPGLESLDYILVCDDYRRMGVASQLVVAAKARWPNIRLTEAISDEGERFMASMETKETLFDGPDDTGVSQDGAVGG